MLVALHKESQKRITAARYESIHELRKEFGLGELVCPCCEQTVFPRERDGFIRHFVHTNSCTSDMARHPESPMHEQGKLALVRYLQRQVDITETEKAKIEVEHRLPHCGANGRVADVALVYDNNNLLICECQLSSITVNELEQRTRDYYSIGADVLWFLGNEADTSSNQKWLKSMFGAYGRVEFTFSKEQEVLVYPEI